MLYGLEKFPKRRRFHSQFMDGFLGTDILEDYPYHREGQISGAGAYPAVNIVEYDKEYEIELAAPGLCKEDYEIKLERDTLRIGTTKEFRKEDSNIKYTRREFEHREFEKAFILPENADTEAISAACNSGILNIHIPKKVIESRPKTKTISIS